MRKLSKLTKFYSCCFNHLGVQYNEKKKEEYAEFGEE